MIYTAICGQPIPLGYAGEEAVTEVVFDISAWVAEFGAGASALTERRPGEDTALPVEISEAAGALKRIPGAYDTAIRGAGEAQMTYTPIGKTKKSQIWTTLVRPSLTSPPDPPQSVLGWVDAVVAAAASVTNMGAEAETLPEGSEATATKTVDPETGAVTITFGIPVGATGATGRGITSVRVLATGEWVIVYTDGTSETVGEDVYSALNALAERAEAAEQEAEAAERGAGNAQAAAERAQEAAETAQGRAEAAKQGAEDAQAGAAVSAASAQAAVGQMVYVSFTMSQAGHLIMKNADLAGTTVFSLGSDGHMEVTL